MGQISEQQAELFASFRKQHFSRQCILDPCLKLPEENQHKLLIRKGIYPYEYMDDWDKFKENKLPSKKAFYSKLNMSDVKEEDYEHAIRVWKEFGLKNLGEYHDLYLKTDVILLANVFEKFRKVSLFHYYFRICLYL